MRSVHLVRVLFVLASRALLNWHLACYFVPCAEWLLVTLATQVRLRGVRRCRRRRRRCLNPSLFRTLRLAVQVHTTSHLPKPYLPLVLPLPPPPLPLSPHLLHGFYRVPRGGCRGKHPRSAGAHQHRHHGQAFEHLADSNSRHRNEDMAGHARASVTTPKLMRHVDARHTSAPGSSRSGRRSSAP